MTGGHDFRDELEPGAPDELIALAQRLERDRPVPAAGFRGDLRRQLLAAGIAAGARPQRLRARIAAFAGSGGLLLVAGALSAAGAGPLGA